MGYQLDPEASHTTKSEMYLQYAPATDRVVNAGYRFRRDFIEQFDVSAAWPISERWRGFARWVYSMREDKTLDQFIGIEYALVLLGACGSCRGVSSTAARAIPTPLSGCSWNSRVCRVSESTTKLSCASRFVDTPRCRTRPNPGSSMIFKRFLYLICGLGAAVAAHADLSNAGVLLDSVAAVVNDGIVLRGELEQQVRAISDRIQQQGQQLPPRNVLRQQVLERLVMQEMQMQRADRLGIKVSDEMLNARADRRRRAQQHQVHATCRPRSSSRASTTAQYRDEMRKQMTLPMLRQRDVYQRIYVSPRELEQCAAQVEGRARASTTNTTSRTSSSRSRCPRRPSRSMSARRRRRAVYEQAPARARISPSSPSRTPTAARRSKAVRSAGARPAAAVDRRRPDPEDEARRHHGADPHAERTPHLQLLNVRGGAAIGAGVAGARASHPDEDQRARGRRDGPPEAQRHPRRAS